MTFTGTLFVVDSVAQSPFLKSQCICTNSYPFLKYLRLPWIVFNFIYFQYCLLFWKPRVCLFSNLSRDKIWHTNTNRLWLSNLELSLNKCCKKSWTLEKSKHVKIAFVEASTFNLYWLIIEKQSIHFLEWSCNM